MIGGSPEPVQVCHGGGGAVAPKTRALSSPQSLRAKLVHDLRALDRFLWTGHRRSSGPPLSLAGYSDHPLPVRAPPGGGPSWPTGRPYEVASPTATNPDSKVGGCSGATGAGGRHGSPSGPRGLPRRQKDLREQCLRGRLSPRGRRRLPQTLSYYARHAHRPGLPGSGPPSTVPGGGRTSALTRTRAGIPSLWIGVLGRPSVPFTASIPAPSRGPLGGRHWPPKSAGEGPSPDQGVIGCNVSRYGLQRAFRGSSMIVSWFSEETVVYGIMRIRIPRG